ncbi:type II toxin-antitoxin system HipA family toxin [Arachidicoccus soli]|uniref:Type II toxin-antitoxin system HipA family toxin n=1 Tax=Arachidicoccus soli TaxID=2341117 RepID=A0A386HSB1_9BACT|nr:HipA domain-containing protein [Arachidicoccus soli]AYD48144.1 type II toxin-antitoxin system HipA family toxin [Arachidicoccus soli]
MSLPDIHFCPGTLKPGYETYSTTCLKRVFQGRKVSHILPYGSPSANLETNVLFEENRKRISISGVQEKFSVILDKNKLRLIDEGERGTYVLKPIPAAGRRPDQMPANEHLTMQLAGQVFGIETAENALIFFADGAHAYITLRFDVRADGSKWAQDDFASLAGRTPQTHGEHYKYQGNYLEIFELLKQYVPAYAIEAPKLLRILMFNYLFSNGDAHFKNFSLLETALGDYRLSPAYDLLNSRIHIHDHDFALDDGLLPPNLAQGKIMHQFSVLAGKADIGAKVFDRIAGKMLSGTSKVEELVQASFLDDTTKRNYLQAYQSRYKQLSKI